MEKTVLRVEGMSCGHCELAIQDAVRKLPGIEKVKASKRKKEVSVEFDSTQVNLDQIKSTIAETGYDIVS